jgi:hypothetical protein
LVCHLETANYGNKVPCWVNSGPVVQISWWKPILLSLAGMKVLMETALLISPKLLPGSFIRLRWQHIHHHRQAQTGSMFLMHLGLHARLATLTIDMLSCSRGCHIAWDPCLCLVPSAFFQRSVGPHHCWSFLGFSIAVPGQSADSSPTTWSSRLVCIICSAFQTIHSLTMVSFLLLKLPRNWLAMKAPVNIQAPYYPHRRLRLLRSGWPP